MGTTIRSIAAVTLVAGLSGCFSQESPVPSVSRILGSLVGEVPDETAASVIVRGLGGHEVGRSTVHMGWFILGDTLPPGRQTVTAATIGTNGAESPAMEAVVA